MIYSRSTYSISSLLISGLTLLAASTSIVAAPTRRSFLQLRQEGHGDSATVIASGSVNGTGADGAQVVEVVASGWYPGWYKTKMPPSAIPWDKYTELTFAFALTTPDTAALDLVSEEDTLTTFVQEAKKNNVSALLSIGGWTGSQYFSPAVASPENRTVFVKTITDIATKFELDGIDFDWEYPNADGIGCNIRSPNDTPNFLEFLKELRADPVGGKLRLTAAAAISPLMDAEGKPSADVSGFAQVLDHLAIMAYDIHGRWLDTIGANAPLNGNCPASFEGSVATAVDAWTAAGFPANKLVLGVPAYGRSYELPVQSVNVVNGTITSFDPVFDKSVYPPGEGETAGSSTLDKCGNPEFPSGVFTFQGLVSAGFLDAKGAAAPGVAYTFDECTQSAFLYKADEKRMVSFDDARTFAAKGKYINDKGLAGFAVWHIAGDTADSYLLNSLHTAMGIEETCPDDESTPVSSSAVPSSTAAPAPSQSA